VSHSYIRVGALVGAPNRGWPATVKGRRLILRG
jgi:hypothetical protein